MRLAFSYAKKFCIMRTYPVSFFLIGKKWDKHLEFLSSGGVWPHKDAVRPAQKSDLFLLQI